MGKSKIKRDIRCITEQMKSKSIIGNYIIIDTHQNPKYSKSDYLKKSFIPSYSAETIVPSIKLARKLIISDTLNSYDPEGNSGKDENWAGDMLICKIVKVVRPIPSVKVTATLKTIAQ